MALGAGLAVMFLMYIESRKEALPPETWQEIEETNHFFLTPPGYLWRFEVEERDGKLHWRRTLIPIPKKWYESTKTPETIIETPRGKKKKKTELATRFDLIDENGVLQDSNRDGIVEFSTALWFDRQENGAEILWTGFIHICCECSLTHRVSVRVYRSFGGFRISQRWDVDEKATHWNRIRKFGPNYQNPHPFNNPFYDPFPPETPYD